MMNWTSLYRVHSPLGHQTWDPHPAQVPGLGLGLPASDILFAITGDLFKIVHLRTPSLVLTSIDRSMYSLQVGGTHPTGMFFVVQVFTCTCRYALCSATQWMDLCATLTWLAVTATTGNYLSIMAISIDRYTLY